MGGYSEAIAGIYTTRIYNSHGPYRDSSGIFAVAGTHGLLGLAVEVGSRDWSARAAAGSGEVPLWRQ